MKVIFVRNLGFGDVIWTEPIVRHFVSKQEEVHLFTTHPYIFDHYPTDHLKLNPWEKLFPIPESPISLQFEENPQMHYLECFRMQAGIPHLQLTPPQLHLSPEEKKRKIEKPYAILHLDFYPDQFNFRNVYGIDWKEVVSYLQGQGLEVFQISKKAKSLVAPWIPTEDFREIMSILYHCDLFIGLDSGPSHIASALGIPSLIFFGSVNPKYRHLDENNKVFLQQPCPFAHCYHELAHSFGQKCRLVKEEEAPPCCRQETDDVIQAALSLLQKKPS